MEQLKKIMQENFHQQEFSPELSQKTPLESFDHIELTDEERQVAIEEALRVKRAKIREIEYWKKVKEKPIIQVMNQDDLQAWCIKRWETIHNKKFIIDSNSEHLLHILGLYFTQNSEFNDFGYSLSKGLLLAGNIGVGKTAMMQLFARNQLSSFIIKSTRQIANEFAERGICIIDDYIGETHPSRDNPFNQQFFGICFDDIGVETKRKNYGNESNVMEEILLGRYDNRYKLQNKTHITTNLNAQELEECYGKRTTSRMREMFNIIVFERTEDLRK